MSSEKKGTRRAPIVVGIIVVVLACAAGGFFVWHNQPSFCNAVCHEPMDYYVQGYFGESQGASSTQAGLAQAHAKADVTCLQCHTATIKDQVNEATAWMSGTYETSSDGGLSPALITADKKMCATAGCHDWNDVVAATQDWGGVAGVNPHVSHQGEAIDCSNCHRVHEQSVMYCNACHDYKVPDGWSAPARS